MPALLHVEHVHTPAGFGQHPWPRVIYRTSASLQLFQQCRQCKLPLRAAAAMAALKFPERLDLFWISQNYHDLHDRFMGPVDVKAFNRAVYEALKPGGCYVVLDHSAAAGAPSDVTETLHRIDQSTVRSEIEAAGFKFDGHSALLANPADPRTASVFDASVRGHTDQFILRFRKPK